MRPLALLLVACATPACSLLFTGDPALPDASLDVPDTGPRFESRDRDPIAVGGQPRGIRIADLDLDGRPELVVATAGETSIAIVSPLEGTSSVVQLASMEPGTSPWDVAIGRFDRDATHPEIAVLLSCPTTPRCAGAAVVLKRTAGLGSYAESFRHANEDTMATPARLSAADVDGDGADDLLISNFFRDRFSKGSVVVVYATLQPNGRHDYDTLDPMPATGPGGVLGAKLLETDAVPRVLYAAYQAPSTSMDGALAVSKRIGVSTLSWGPPVFSLLGGKIGQDVAVIAKGGVAELVIASRSTPPGFVAFAPDVEGGLTRIGATALGGDPVALVAADSGGPFVAAALVDRDQVAIVELSRTMAPESAGEIHAVGQRPIAIAAGDLDGDGKIDLAIANEGSDQVSLLFGRR